MMVELLQSQGLCRVQGCTASEAVYTHAGLPWPAVTMHRFDFSSTFWIREQRVATGSRPASQAKPVEPGSETAHTPMSTNENAPTFAHRRA